MQPVIACVPGWNRLLLLLRRIPMLATICTVLCDSLFRSDADPDSHTDTTAAVVCIPPLYRQLHYFTSVHARYGVSEYRRTRDMPGGRQHLHVRIVERHAGTHTYVRRMCPDV